MKSSAALAFLLLSLCPAEASPKLDPPQAGEPAAAEPAVIDLGDGAIAVIPVRVDPTRPAPLLLLMHGAGGTAASLFQPFLDEARRRGVVLLGLKSRNLSWDAVEARLAADDGRSRLSRRQAFRLDPPRIERALGRLLVRVPIDRNRIGLAGFSDGASYALSIGTANPDLFSAILAFSPGMGLFEGRFRTGQPVFVSHARNDRILDYQETANRIVPRLRSGGLAVTFRTFDDGHRLTPQLIREGLDLFLGPLPPG